MGFVYSSVSGGLLVDHISHIWREFGLCLYCFR